MNKGAIALLSFVAGGAAGYILAKKVTEQDVEQRIQDEVDSVKMALKREAERKAEQEEKLEKAVDAHSKYSGREPAPKKEEKAEEKDDRPEPAKPDEAPRRAYRAETAKTEEQLHKMAAALKPRVISPDELGDRYGEDNVINLTYFQDGVLCGTDMKPLRDVDIAQMVGEDYAEHFGEYEDDSVAIINDGLKAEYEILADERTYVQYLHEHPEMRMDLKR